MSDKAGTLYCEMALRVKKWEKSQEQMDCNIKVHEVNKYPNKNMLSDAFSEPWTSIRIYVKDLLWLLLFIPLL